MENEGWIKLHRKFMTWEWYADDHMVRLFVHLLLEANHKPQRWRGILIERGQLVTGRFKLSENTGISEQSIRTCLNRLKSTSEITIKSTSKYSIITICNYNKYNLATTEINQQINQQSNQQLTSNQPATNQQLTTSNNNKKEENEKKIDYYALHPSSLGSNPGPLNQELADKAFQIGGKINKWRVAHGLKQMKALLDGTEKKVVIVLRTETDFDIDKIMEAANLQPILWTKGLFNLDWLTKRNDNGDYNYKLILNYQWQAKEEKERGERLR